MGAQVLEVRAQNASDNFLGRAHTSQEGPLIVGMRAFIPPAISFLNKVQFSLSVVVNTDNRLFSLQSRWRSHLKWYNGLLFIVLWISLFTTLCKPTYLLQALKIDSPLLRPVFGLLSSSVPFIAGSQKLLGFPFGWQKQYGVQ